MSKTRAFLVLGTILIVYIILFPFTKSHEHIPQKCIHSMSNLRRIAIFLLMYAQENDNLLPENIEQVEEYNKMSDVFKSPLKPIDFNGPSYIYVSGHTLIKGEKLNPKYIFVYENPEYRAEYMDDKINTLFLDGHVERLEKERFLSLLKSTYEHLGKPMPEIKFKEQVPVTETK